MMPPAIEELLRPELKELVPYEPYRREGMIMLDANENPYPLPDGLYEEICREAAARQLTRYPDPTAEELRREIAAYAGVEPEQVVVGNGSDELIQLLLLTFGGPGTFSLIPYPTFSMYAVHTTITGGRVIAVPCREDFSLPLPELAEKISSHDVHITFLASPNNPTGAVFGEEELRFLLAKARGLVVVDEAYFEFYGRSFVPLIQEFSHLVILRTFSKAFALAGFRVGYLIAAEEVTAQLFRTKQPYNLNTFSQTAALVALKRRDLYRPLLQEIVAGREELYRALSLMPGIKPFPSWANYILFRTEKKPASVVHRELKERGILIRNLHGAPGLDNCLRVTVGQREEREKFLLALQEVLG